jgi:enoyl-CoA hydratase/carnithine racemase
MNSVQHLKLENRGGCLWITLARPDKANALSVYSRHLRRTKRWLNRGLKTALAEARAESERHRAVTAPGKH